MNWLFYKLLLKTLITLQGRIEKMDIVRTRLMPLAFQNKSIRAIWRPFCISCAAIFKDWQKEAEDCADWGEQHNID